MNTAQLHFFVKESMKLAPEKAEHLSVLKERQRKGQTGLVQDFDDMLSGESGDLRKKYYGGYSDDELRYIRSQIDSQPIGYPLPKARLSAALKKYKGLM